MDATQTLARGVRRMIDVRIEDPMTAPGAQKHFEGEDIWNPMLPAQYAMAMHIMRRPLDETRKRRLLKQFEHEQLPCGRWGMHRFGEPSLFMTTMVYVAARTLGAEPEGPLLKRANQWFRTEDVLEIPSWGKVWLSLMSLYGWEGVNAVPPEAWLIPEKLAIHPANYYCHTRLIYMGMASVFGLKLQAGRSALVDSLREELYPGRDFEQLDFRGSRHRLREGDLWAPPTQMLKAMYEAVNVFERVHPAWLRRRCLADLRKRMRWELQSSEYTCLSPVNGLLFMLTLWAWDPTDPVVRKQMQAFEGWIWEDEDEGLRICGARSATWDTSFALQALSEARPHLDPEVRSIADDALIEGLAWLRTQQMKGPAIGSVEDYQKAYRLDPTGGFCFAGVWHGWPVSDCTAEALCAFLDAPRELFSVDRSAVERGVRFMLQCQNPEGGFGSYESRKASDQLEWMNPAEMFGDSMTELGYMECTASNLVALCEVRERYPNMLQLEVRRAIRKAESYLREKQNADGSWTGSWGVAFIYGTLFGIRGLLATGASPLDPAIRRACEFLKQHQRADGAWGEHWRSCLTDRYEQLDHGHVVQTAWAMQALLEAEDPDFEALQRAARWLADAQLDDGDWPEQEFAGVFFRTALIEYRMYRRFFPIWALSLYEARRKTHVVAEEPANATILSARPAR